MTKFKLKKLLPYLLGIILIALFLFLRLYKIQTSLLFFNDIGRDFLTFWRWQQTGKPPLLGPQTSALPFNQSAIYFYVLYPFYLLTHGSAYATIIACNLFYVLSFILGLWLLRKKVAWRNSLFIVFFLISIHPQYILQTRFVWNPSFVTPFVLVAFYLFFAIWEKFKKSASIDGRLSWFLAFSLAIAASLSYSTAPTVLAFLILAIVFFKVKSWTIFLKSAVAMFLSNLATVVFELRHGFVLTQMMLNRTSSPQDTSWLNKLTAFNVFSLANLAPYFWLIILLLAVIYLYLHKKQQLGQAEQLILILFLLSLAITLIVPIGMQAHYIFGLLPLIFLLLAFLSLKNSLALTIILFLSLFWLKPQQFEPYFAPAYRSLKVSEQCAEDFCASHQQPLFVAVQSDQHPYHNAMEWQYLSAKAGCQLKDLVTETAQADYLALFIDDSHYQHGSTTFNELSIFGPSEEIERFYCSNKLTIVLLESLE